MRDFRHVLDVVWSAAERVSFRIFASCAVGDREVIAAEQLRPADLSSVEDLSHREKYEILVVGVHRRWVTRAFKVDAPLLKGHDYCQEFLIMYFIIKLGWAELS